MDESVDFDFFDDKPASRHNSSTNHSVNQVEKAYGVVERRSSSSSSSNDEKSSLSSSTDQNSTSTATSDLHGIHDEISNSEDKSDALSLSNSSSGNSSSTLTDQSHSDDSSDQEQSLEKTLSYSSGSSRPSNHPIQTSSDSDDFMLDKNLALGASMNSGNAVTNKKSKKYRKSLKVNIPSSSNGDSSDSMTDVSPLTSPDKSPNFNHRQKSEPDEQSRGEPYRHITKLNVVFKENTSDSGHENDAPLPGKEHILSPSGRRTSNSAQWSNDSDSDDDDAIDSLHINQYHDGTYFKNDSHRKRQEYAAVNHRQRLLDSAARGSMDISSLLETVLEFENQNKTRKARQQNIDLPLNYRIGEKMMNDQERRTKKNMSFSNDQVREIDQENKRLLKKITSYSRPSSAASVRSNASSVRSSASSVRSNASSRSSCSRKSRSSFRPGSSKDKPVRLYHTAVNRLQYQRQIERENMQLLKRLQSAKPTPGLQRQRQLSHYKQQSDYMGTSISRSGMSLQKANELTRNAEVVQKAIGISKSKPKRPTWEDRW